MLDNLIKSLTNKELETYFRKSRDLWYKVRKFVNKNKNKSQIELNNLLKLSKTLDGYTGYKFSIAPNINIFLTVEDNIEGLIHNNIYHKNGYLNFDLIIPTIIPHNKEELTSGKKIFYRFLKINIHLLFQNLCIFMNLCIIIKQKKYITLNNGNT